MTENEAKAIRWIRNIKDDTVIVKEEIFDNKAMCCNILPHTIRTEININAEIIIKAISELDKYREIGTVEECREAMERQRAKKPVKYGDTRKGLDNDGNSISWQEDCYECPTCESFLGYVSDCEDEQYQNSYCRNCGQAIDFSEV